MDWYEKFQDRLSKKVVLLTGRPARPEAPKQHHHQHAREVGHPLPGGGSSARTCRTSASFVVDEVHLIGGENGYGGLGCGPALGLLCAPQMGLLLLVPVSKGGPEIF